MDSPDQPASPAPRKRKRKSRQSAVRGGVLQGGESTGEARARTSGSGPVLEGRGAATDSDSPPDGRNGEAEELRAPDGTQMRRQDHGGALLSGGGHALGHGRPSLYDSAFCARVVEMGARGLTQARMAAELGVSKQSITEWCRLHPDFADAVSIARERCLAYFEAVGTDGLVYTPDGPRLNERQWSRMVARLWPEEWAEPETMALGRVPWAELPPELLARIAAGESALALLVSAGLVSAGALRPGPVLEAQVLEEEAPEAGEPGPSDA